MEIFSFIFILIFISFTCYWLLEDDYSDLLHERMEKITGSQESGKNTRKSNEAKNFMMIFLRPVLSRIANRNNNDIKKLLTEAGLSYSEDDVLRFTGKRLFFSFFGFIISILFLLLLGFDTNTLMIAVCIPITAFILPVIDLRTTAKKRANEITYNLPDALDLLTVCVEAGLGLDAAMVRVAKEFSRTSEILSSELERVSKDIMAGVPRQTAFRNLAHRNNVPDLQSLVALLIQTDKLGTSIAQSLRVYCDTVRTRRRQRVEALSQKASVKMIIPLVFFILPAMFVVILAPAAITMSQNMK